VNGLVDGLETVTEGLLHVADAMKLCVVRSHHRAIVAEKLFAAVAEIAQRLVMQHASIRLRNVWVQNRLRAERAL